MLDEFAQSVRDVLDHLYDYAYLEDCALAVALDLSGRALPKERMRHLRSIILSCLEKMAPDCGISIYSPRVRSYHVLTLRYVDRLPVQRVATELALSERQVYRDMRQAENDLAEVLWAWIESNRSSESDPREFTKLELALRELNRLPGERHALDMNDMLDGAIDAVGRLADQLGVNIRLSDVADLGSITNDKQTVRQVLVGLLSHMVQHSAPESDLFVRAQRRRDDKGVSLEIRFSPVGNAYHLPEVIAGLVQQLGGFCYLEHDDHQAGLLTVGFVDQHAHKVLVIDDNADLLELFQRYLTGGQYEAAGASDSAEGLAKAVAWSPDVIFLDVLIPGQDGWDVLQQLKTRHDTAEIPVIICSVLGSPALAQSLGASGYVPKPVSRADLMEELTRWCPAS